MTDDDTIECPTCEGGAVGFGQTNAGIFKRCPQCHGDTFIRRAPDIDWAGRDVQRP